MQRKVLIFVATLLVAGCATSPEAQVWAACRTFSDTQKSLQVFKPKMSVVQKARMLEAVRLTRPICVEKKISDPKSALDTVHDYLGRLVALQNEVK